MCSNYVAKIMSKLTDVFDASNESLCHAYDENHLHFTSHNQSVTNLDLCDVSKLKSLFSKFKARGIPFSNGGCIFLWGKGFT